MLFKGPWKSIVVLGGGSASGLRAHGPVGSDAPTGRAVRLILGFLPYCQGYFTKWIVVALMCPIYK